MSARDIIHGVLINHSGSSATIRADAILSVLKASGYRILGPGELDAETLEAAAEVAENSEVRVSYGVLAAERNEPIIHRQLIASAIRALKDKRDG